MRNKEFKNTQLKDALAEAIAKKQLKLAHPKGYEEWKKKFDYFYGITNSVEQTLNIIYGTDGGSKDYKGSLYNNSNFDVKNLPKKKAHKHTEQNNKPSNVFDYIRNTKHGTGN